MIQTVNKTAKPDVVHRDGLAVRSISYGNDFTPEQIMADFHARQANPAYQEMAVGGVLSNE